jgi:CRISPR-associated protein Cas1
MQNLRELPKLRDSLSYVYLEHGRLEQSQKAVDFVDKDGGITHLPTASLSVLLLGPGTTITHAAIKSLADNGCLVQWTGEDGTKFYAQGLGETRKAYHLLRQAQLASNPQRRLAVIRAMYQFRFAEALPLDLTLEQIRGYEGRRVRDLYAHWSQETGVPWHGRRYQRGNWAGTAPINRAISAANALLNGLCHTAIVSGGYSPAIGFIHTGKQLSFVYDVADLYKATHTIPVAFQTVAEGTHTLEKRVRLACREAFKRHRLLDEILKDIDTLLEANHLPPDAGQADLLDEDPALPTPLWGDPDLPLDLSDVGDLYD